MTFEEYCIKDKKEIVKSAKKEGLTFKQFINQRFRKSIMEYRAMKKRIFIQNTCHSFWHTEYD